MHTKADVCLLMCSEFPFSVVCKMIFEDQQKYIYIFPSNFLFRLLFFRSPSSVIPSIVLNLSSLAWLSLVFKFFFFFPSFFPFFLPSFPLYAFPYMQSIFNQEHTADFHAKEEGASFSKPEQGSDLAGALYNKHLMTGPGRNS